MPVHQAYLFLEKEKEEGRLANNLLVEHLQNLVCDANTEVCLIVARAAGLRLYDIFPEKFDPTRTFAGSARYEALDSRKPHGWSF